jgi:hypothetical protein
MIKIDIEPFSIVEDNKQLIEQHWDEVVADKSVRQLDVDWEMFRAMEDMGRLVTIVAREDGEVAGYAVFIIQRHFHAKQTVCAHNDALFLRKESRKGRAGIMLIKESRQILERLLGKVLIMWHVKPHVDFSPILTKLGYYKHETIYALSVGD